MTQKCVLRAFQDDLSDIFGPSVQQHADRSVPQQPDGGRRMDVDTTGARNEASSANNDGGERTDADTTAAQNEAASGDNDVASSVNKTASLEGDTTAGGAAAADDPEDLETVARNAITALNSAPTLPASSASAQHRKASSEEQQRLLPDGPYNPAEGSTGEMPSVSSSKRQRPSQHVEGDRFTPPSRGSVSGPENPQSSERLWDHDS